MAKTKRGRETMSFYIPTVSGNEPETEPIPEESQTEETTENLTQNVYNIDNTQVCELLTKLIEEVQKTNETNNKIYETMLLHHAEHLQNYNNSMELFKENLVNEPEPETESETETETHEDFIEEQLLLIGENLEEINVTVSGNNAILTDINGTTESWMEVHTERIEEEKETDTQTIALSIGTVFVTSVIAGLIIAKIIWGRMK